jgi:ribosome-binding protein aMBF1 (putative translation factor)
MEEIRNEDVAAMEGRTGGNTDALVEKVYGPEGSAGRIELDRNVAAMEVGATIIQARKAAGMTQVELAKRIHRSVSYVSKIERGSNHLDAGMYIVILRILGVKLELPDFGEEVIVLDQSGGSMSVPLKSA